MAEQSVGQISLDLILNSKDFKKQLTASVNDAVKSASTSCNSTISSMFGKMGKIAAAAFSVKALYNFGKQAIELGSDLAEVQNVVDVAFGDMSAAADEWAKNSVKDFGLSETTAKRYLGTFGAMASSFGYSNKEALKMSETLVGLSGDVASFYNISSSEAYTKLKSVFTGETESLKELGVVMTQTALDQYALEKGYGKTTKAMTEQEKVALRLDFVTNRLNKASGDFIRTQDSWSNQSRVLTEQFRAMQTQLGQAFIQVLTPVIKMLNILMEKLVQVATLFNQFTAKLFGKQEVKGVSTVTESMETLQDNTAGVGDAAAASAKKIKKSLAGFDEINVLQSNEDTSAGGAGGGLEMAGLENGAGELDNINKELDKTKSRLEELFDIFKDGFSSVFNPDDFKPVIENIKRIGQALKDIFTSPEVQAAFNDFAERAAFALGQIVGSVASIGTSIAQFLTGSIARYLEDNTDYIKERVANFFDISGHIAQQAGNTAAAFATIFEALRSPEFEKLGADIISVIVNPLMLLGETLLRLQSDVFDVITQPIIDHAEEIKQAFIDLAAMVDKPIAALSEMFKNLSESFTQMYEEHIHPMFMSFKEGLSDTFGKFLDIYNEYVAPFIDYVAEGLSELITNNVGPMMEKAIEFIGKVADAIKVIYEEVLKPLIDWIIANVIPVLVPILQQIWDNVKNFLGHVFDIIGDLLDILNGILDFLIGVFTGDWERAWDGIKQIVSGVFNGILDIITGVIDLIVGFIAASLQEILGTVKLVLKAIIDFIAEVIGKIISTVTTFASSLTTLIPKIISDVFKMVVGGCEKIVDSLVKVFSGLWNSIKGIINSILGGIEMLVNGIINGINKAIDALNKLDIDVPDWVPSIGGKSFGLNIPTINGNVKIPKLAQGGYVNANTPQLAMVGDNKREGEIVAPESKIAEAVAAGMRTVLNTLNIGQMQAAGAGDITIPIYLDGAMLENVVVKSDKINDLRTGAYR